MYKGFVLGFGPMGALFYSKLKDSEEISMKVLETPEKKIDDRPFYSVTAGNLTRMNVTSVSVASLYELKSIKGPKFIFIATRANDLEDVLESLEPHVDPDCELVLCQNGIGIYDMAERHFAHLNIHRLVIYAGAVWRDDGTSVRELIATTDIPHVGLVSKVRATSFLSEILTNPKITVEEGTNMRTLEWQKAVMNIYANPLLALTGLETSFAVSDPILRELSLKLASEAVVVAQRLRIDLDMNFVLRLQKITASLTQHRCSTLKDIELGRKTEIEWLNGAVIREAKKLGLQAPFNETIKSLIEAFENHGIKPAKVVPSISDARRLQKRQR